MVRPCDIINQIHLIEKSICLKGRSFYIDILTFANIMVGTKLTVKIALHNDSIKNI